MKTTLITGANRGIGLALAKRLAERGDHVIGVCRNASDELRASKVHIEDGVDVTHRDDIASLAHRLGDTRIDWAIMNAGTLGEESLGGIDADAEQSIREQFRVNALGPLLVVQALLDKFADAAKIGLVTSRMGSIEDNGSGGYYGYRMSKAALNAAGKSLAVDLKPKGVAVFLLHPGYVKTRMTDHGGDITPEEAAKRLIARMDELGLEQTGSFWHSDGSPLPW